jgi:hypothetical protein
MCRYIKRTPVNSNTNTKNFQKTTFFSTVLMFAQGEGKSRESLDDGPEKYVKKLAKNKSAKINSTHVIFATCERQNHKGYAKQNNRET